MQDIQINSYLLLGLAELVIALTAACVFLWLRSCKAVKSPVVKSEEKNASISYQQYLETNIEKSIALIKSDSSDTDILEMRKSFLEIERDLHQLDQGSTEFQQTLETRINELLGRGDDQPQETKKETPEDSDFDKLKDIIDNQNQAFQAIRKKIESHADEFSNLEEINSALDEYDRQSSTLNLCVETLEKEHSQLKSSDAGTDRESVEKGNLLEIVNGQKATIGTLQTLIVKLPPGSDVSEFESMLDAIQRTTKELNSCVAVLESENARLSTQLNEAKAELAKQEEATEEENVPADAEEPSPEGNEEPQAEAAKPAVDVVAS